MCTWVCRAICTATSTASQQLPGIHCEQNTSPALEVNTQTRKPPKPFKKKNDQKPTHQKTSKNLVTNCFSHSFLLLPKDLRPMRPVQATWVQASPIVLTKIHMFLGDAFLESRFVWRVALAFFGRNGLSVFLGVVFFGVVD